MLTRTHGFKKSSWKYILLVPTLFGCTFLLAKNASKTDLALKGNQKVYNGNVFTWRESDTISYNKQTGEVELVNPYTKIKPEVITGINDEPVYQNDQLKEQATYGKAPTDFAAYVIKEFHALREHTQDSQSYIVNLNLVIDKEGKIVYYDADYAKPFDPNDQQRFWATLYNPKISPNALMDKILAKNISWKPATYNGKPVNSFVRVSIPGC